MSGTPPSSQPPTGARPQAHAAAGSRPDESPRFRYTAELANQIELRWQKLWDEHGAFRQPNPGEPGFDAARPKFYCLDMFPYPSGAGLHVGHPEGYTASDIISRYKRMAGFNVLHPMGWDAFGLPAEQYAIQTGIHPATTTRVSIDTFRRQLKRFGFSYDWSREFGTIDPEYYRWTQWIFLQLYDSWFDPDAPAHDGKPGRARPITELIKGLESGEYLVGVSGELARPAVDSFTGPLGGAPVGARPWHQLTQQERRLFLDNHRLAYVDETTVNWCPKLGTVLANDEVIDGRSERGGHPVVRKPLKQWMFRITAYADRLLRQLDGLAWPESTKTQQREWIGKSDGAEIEFPLADLDHMPELKSALGTAKSATPGVLTVYTTRPDTIFGATFMVIAPEHPLVELAVRHPTAETDAQTLRAYAEKARNTSDVDRMNSREKSGVFTGLYCVNPATRERIPVYVADYVLMGYGHGAIMAVPAHDQRDFDFAQAIGLPIRDVIYPRTVAALAYFGANANDEEQRYREWKSVLADFVGLVTSKNIAPGDFAGALQTIRDRPRAAGVELPEAVTAEDALARGRRGSVRLEWLEMIDAVGFEDFDGFRDLFAAANYHRASGAAHEADGFMVNSSYLGINLNGMTAHEAKEEAIRWLEREGLGRRQTNFRLRDWTFSRQRYWGEPIPIVYDQHGNHYPVSSSALPVVLPALDDYAPVESDDPRPLLAKASAWMNTTAGAAGVDPTVLPPATPVRREANTMPGSAGSSWYALRYCDPRNTQRFVGAPAEKYWMRGPGNDARLGGVDLYIGGSEHAVGHLLYSRFWQNVLHDLGHASTPEPFQTLFHQGLITSFAYQRADKTLVPVDEVEEVAEGDFRERSTGAKLTPVVAKMSKSLKNVVNPDDIITAYGADSFRIYEMYMGPLEASKPWNTKDLVGLFRFLQRVWRLVVDEETGALRAADAADPELERLLHRATHKVAGDIERLAFNTAIAALIEFVNAATTKATAGGKGARAVLSEAQIERLALLLAPFTPHLAEEVWEKLGRFARAGSIAKAAWPTVDRALLQDQTVELAVQVQGKVRARIVVATNATPSQVEAQALADEEVIKALNGKAVKRVVVVPGKLVNIVI